MHYLVETGQLQRLQMLEPSSSSGVNWSQPQLLLSSGRASAGTIKHLSLTRQDGLLETVGLDRIDGCPVLTAMLSLRAAPKGMSLCTKQETLGHGRLLSTPHPSAGWILRDIPRLLGPGGRDFKSSEI